HAVARALRPALFPYTTLFRSPTRSAACSEPKPSPAISLLDEPRPDASAAQWTALGERLGGVARCLLKPFGAFLVAPGGEPLALAQAHDRAVILDREDTPAPGRRRTEAEPIA